MSDVLERICADTRTEVARRKRERGLADVEAAARAAPPPRGFAAALDGAVAGHGKALIAEIKKASPSGGLIRPEFDPPSLALAYEAGGATCLSVLTDGPWFQGNDADLAAARDAVKLPVLRKDFMLDPWQIAESRAIGADAVLVILAAVDDGLARELTASATDHGMDVLVETHDEDEVDRAVALGATLIGINNRNLRTLVTDLAVTGRLAGRVPADRSIVSESGIRVPADLARLATFGAHRYLVGERLMRQPDPGAATRALLDPAPQHAGIAGGSRR